ncbi:hypothetical protein BGZ61DRAFT_236366 [Ilyonectria robusta]|uniref:uncharacterized protein n=1 Tax=Ilyonectria robusta TaxID=1079257 RepID=UPI001E8D4088|nr:uncharacterized protein BGZ61DRAFT_236366 [Ilyonectria robusta]KAH8699723.1 hypothetical protein BGZ61DRAFT_236366 [Ilyonectria robusta]
MSPARETRRNRPKPKVGAKREIPRDQGPGSALGPSHQARPRQGRPAVPPPSRPVAASTGDVPRFQTDGWDFSRCLALLFFFFLLTAAWGARSVARILALSTAQREVSEVCVIEDSQGQMDQGNDVSASVACGRSLHMRSNKNKNKSNSFPEPQKCLDLRFTRLGHWSASMRTHETKPLRTAGQSHARPDTHPWTSHLRASTPTQRSHCLRDIVPRCIPISRLSAPVFAPNLSPCPLFHLLLL